MVRCTMSLSAGSGGAVLRIMVRDGTAWVTMVVAYMPTAAAATVGSTLDVSRLLKHIPVYGFYGYWRIKGLRDFIIEENSILLFSSSLPFTKDR